MIVFGKNVARDLLLNNNKKVEKIILQEGFSDNEILSLIEKRNINVITKQKRDIDRLISGVHQGILLYIPDYQYSSIETAYNDDVVVILDHLEDPHNLGAIIRTCEAAGIRSIILPKDRQVQINDKISLSEKPSCKIIFSTFLLLFKSKSLATFFPNTIIYYLSKINFIISSILSLLSFKSK